MFNLEIYCTALQYFNVLDKLPSYIKPLGLGDNNYPANTMSLWPEVDLNALDIWEVVEDRTNFKDTEWYTNTDVTHTYNSGTGKVDATYGTATAKAIDDVTVDGIITEGLKTIKKELIDRQCAGLLQDNDWRVTKQEETGSAMDSGWKTWRASVRTKCNSMQAQIDGAADVDELAALYEYTGDPSTRPLGDFPVKE